MLRQRRFTSRGKVCMRCVRTTCVYVCTQYPQQITLEPPVPEFLKKYQITEEYTYVFCLFFSYISVVISTFYLPVASVDFHRAHKPEP